MNQNEFIQMIGNAAVVAYPTYKILPSLTIAQAILESGWGKSGLSKECYNYFGMKWKQGCGCDYKEYSTKEQRKDGSYYTITARFRKYPDTASGIRGYYEFLSGYKRYHNLIGVTDAEKACDLIRQDGWATSLAYATNLKNLIKKYNLTAYDQIALGKVAGTITVRVDIKNLRIRSGPGTDYVPIGKHTGAGTFIITEVQSGKGSNAGWGKPNTGEGWIALDYATRI